MKFRKKATAVIDAEQWFLGKEVRGVFPPIEGELPRHHVMTMHNQVVFLEDGDWIAAEPDGIHFYPIKDNVMRLTYDEIIS